MRNSSLLCDAHNRPVLAAWWYHQVIQHPGQHMGTKIVCNCDMLHEIGGRWSFDFGSENKIIAKKLHIKEYALHAISSIIPNYPLFSRDRHMKC